MTIRQHRHMPSLICNTLRLVAVGLFIGGAYAVLTYVYQGAVQTHGWLAPEQMIDGLALGETTPRLLIMIVAFVGFVGGLIKALFGMDSLFFSGAVTACVATFFAYHVIWAKLGSLS